MPDRNSRPSYDAAAAGQALAERLSVLVVNRADQAAIERSLAASLRVTTPAARTETLIAAVFRMAQLLDRCLDSVDAVLPGFRDGFTTAHNEEVVQRMDDES